ncbi:formate dehydrogenase accessory sulfurtransferase FdhD [Euzebya sp.]|uniref:formate dehydrogenase accessory sulfurtransferase FdhD n=1 Tax=Euzebya sp. TaxID=1971409 RepID=UPI00351966DB
MTSRGPTARVRVRRHDGDDAIGGRATLAVEEPLEIRVDGQVVATTMRTPGHDFDLALGFAITDGGLDPRAVDAMRYCGAGAGEVIASGAAADLSGPYAGDFNVVDVATRDRSGAAVHRHRATAVSTACGICGADVIADLTARAGSVADVGLPITPEVVAAIAPAVRAAQAGFEATGATHAAAAVAADGTIEVVREDVGRHNAVDKVIGALAAERRLPAHRSVLFTSGRVAFEIVAKALVAGFPALVAVSAPTSLAVEVADRAGLTLIGFARDDAFTVYSRSDRVVEPPSA